MASDDVTTTGYQYGDLWARIEEQDMISIEMDDGTVLSLSVDEAEVVSQMLFDLVEAHREIYEGGDGNDEGVDDSEE